MTKIICFLTVRPTKLFYDFCKLLQFDDYKVFLCIDDNSYSIPDYDGVLPIIQMNPAEPESVGFKSSVLFLNNKACSRDKALYFFANKYSEEYEHIWFLEEDVFIPTVQTLSLLDKKYSTGDLLTSSHQIIMEKRNDWHWPHIFRQTRIPPPYSCSMICAIRVSPRLMLAIKRYVEEHKGYFLDEALFNTLALHAGLDVQTPPELVGIVYRKNWKQSDILPTHLYHPVKSIEQQYSFREHLGST